MLTARKAEKFIWKDTEHGSVWYACKCESTGQVRVKVIKGGDMATIRDVALRAGV